MYWVAYKITPEDFRDEVVGLWERMYRTHYSKYQIVRFIGDPLYYIREIRVTNDFAKASCFPKPMKSLTKAKRAVEMLVLMAGD